MKTNDLHKEMQNRGRCLYCHQMRFSVYAIICDCCFHQLYQPFSLSPGL